MSSGLGGFLAGIGLSAFEAKLRQCGYDDLALLRAVPNDTLAAMTAQIGMRQGHALKLGKALKGELHMDAEDASDLAVVLEKLRLDSFADDLVEFGYTLDLLTSMSEDEIKVRP